MDNIKSKIKEAESKNETIVEVPLSDLKELIKMYEECKEDKEKLLAGIESLNNQIKIYNDTISS